MPHRHPAPRPVRRPLSPAQQRHATVVLRIGALELGMGADGRPITMEHVLGLSFDGLLAGADEMTQAQIVAFNASRASLEKQIKALEKPAEKPELWNRTYLAKNALLANQLDVYGKLLMCLAEKSEKFSREDIEAMGNVMMQANAMCRIVKEVCAPSPGATPPSLGL